MLASAIVRVVTFCNRYPWPVIFASIVLAVLSAFYAATHYAINTDTESLLPRTLPWRQSELVLKATFPRRPLLVVVQAPTPELTDIATAKLTRELEGQHDRFVSVRQPNGGLFFERNGLLYLPTDQVAQTLQQLRGAAPLIRGLANDPSLRGAMQALMFGVQGALTDRIPAQALARPVAVLSDTLEDVLAGHQASFSWQELMRGSPASPAELRGFVEVGPKTDFSALQPAHAAEEAIRQAADKLGLGPELNATMRLTGQLAISDEQFATLSKGAALNLIGTIAVVLAIIWLALRSVRIIIAVFISLTIGFALTAAVGLLMVGSFNLISIAFAVLFIGLGADFGIQFAVRYRSERHDYPEIGTALRSAAAKAGGPLALAAASTAVGFFCFLPTAYRGVSELGLIAGVGMIFAFLATITVLSALLTVANPPPEAQRMGFAALAPADRFLTRYRILVVLGTIVLVLAGTPLLGKMSFDFDPMHLQDPNGEAVRTYRELSTQPDVGIDAAEVIAPSLIEAVRIAREFAGFPEVASARTIETLIPSDQKAKLPLIRAAASSLEPAINVRAKPTPSDAQNIEALRATAAALSGLAGRLGADQGNANRLAGLLIRLADADPTMRTRAQSVLVLPLTVDLERLRNMLRPEEVTLQNLPSEIVRDWVASDGKARVEILPKGDPNDIAVLQRFVKRVIAAAPQATGMPVSLVHSQHTVIGAFIEAGIWAILAIGVILWLALRRFGDVLLTLVPLVVAAAVTLELTAVLGQPLNFANVIALPLLLGVGVAFKIYYITAWRAGSTNLLQSTLTRAVFFSALTTATAFGSLCLSNQPGLSSMGKLMALALVCTLFAAVLFQPALMGPPRQRRSAVTTGEPVLPVPPLGRAAE